MKQGRAWETGRALGTRQGGQLGALDKETTSGEWDAKIGHRRVSGNDGQGRQEGSESGGANETGLSDKNRAANAGDSLSPTQGLSQAHREVAAIWIPTLQVGKLSHLGSGEGFQWRRSGLPPGCLTPKPASPPQLWEGKRSGGQDPCTVVAAWTDVTCQKDASSRPLYVREARVPAVYIAPRVCKFLTDMNP